MTYQQVTNTVKLSAANSFREEKKKAKLLL